MAARDKWDPARVNPLEIYQILELQVVSHQLEPVSSQEQSTIHAKGLLGLDRKQGRVFIW